MSTNTALLKKLEDTLLRELSNATGNILDNQELIATLESAKEKAVDISHKLTTAKATAKDIEEARVRYSPVATRGAVLFFVMAGLSAVNNMYEYSLAAFLKVFKQVGLGWVAGWWDRQLAAAWLWPVCLQRLQHQGYSTCGMQGPELAAPVAACKQQSHGLRQHRSCSPDALCAPCFCCCSLSLAASVRWTWQGVWVPSLTPSPPTPTATSVWACLCGTS